MTTDTIQHLNGDYWGVEVDGGGHAIFSGVRGNQEIRYNIMYAPGKFKLRIIPLPKGEWEIAKGIVEWYEDSNDSSYDPMYNVTTYFNVYKDYVDGDDFDTALNPSNPS